MTTWDYEARMTMGLISGKGDRQHSNGNVRDTSNPDNARHAPDRTVQPNLDAVRALRSGTDGYNGRHRDGR